MEGDSAPKMDWTSKYLPTAWRAFRQHCEFTFGGPLKRKIEEEKCNYLMIWVRDIYKVVTYTIRGNWLQMKWRNSRRITQDLKPMWSPDRTRCLLGINFIWERNKPVSHLNSFLVKDCDYADPDEMVRDRVVIGCYSSKAREKPIHEGSDLTLEKYHKLRKCKHK